MGDGNRELRTSSASSWKSGRCPFADSMSCRHNDGVLLSGGRLHPDADPRDRCRPSGSARSSKSSSAPGFPTQLLLIAVLRGFGMPMQLAEGGTQSHVRLHRVAARRRRWSSGWCCVPAGASRVARATCCSDACGCSARRSSASRMIPLAFFIVVADPRRWCSPTRRSCTTWRAIRSKTCCETGTDAVIFAVVVMVAGGVREEVQRGFIVHRFGQYLGGGVVRRRCLQRALRPRPLRAGLRRDRSRPPRSARSGASSTCAAAASSRRW